MAGGRVTADEIEAGCLLQLFLDPVRYLFDRLIDRGARPTRLHDHRLDREVRVLISPEALVGKQAGRDDDDHQKPDERAVAQRPVRKIDARAHAPGCAAAGDSFTCCPGRKACVPAVTTTSPFFRPLEIMAAEES